MPEDTPEPAVRAGAMYFVHDRMSDPFERVTAVQPVPGHPQLWVIRGRGGHEVVCPASALAVEPTDSCFAVLRRLLP